jgi:hypothetical protein
MNRRALFEPVNRTGHPLRRRLDGWSRQASGRDAALWPGRSVGAQAKPTRVVGRVRHAGHRERLRAGGEVAAEFDGRVEHASRAAAGHGECRCGTRRPRRSPARWANVREPEES